MQRPFESGGLTQCTVELELQNPREKIADIRHVCGNVILGGGIKVGFAAIYRRGDALIFFFQVPPCLVVLVGLDLAGENFPPPFIDRQTEGQEGNFVECHLEQVANVRAFRRHGV